MNTQQFSRTLKLAGVLLILCAYLFLAKLSFATGLGMAWVGISLIATSVFVHSKKPEVRNTHLKSKEVSLRSRHEAEA